MTKQILSRSIASLTVFAGSLTLMFAFAGCDQTPKHPDVKDAVNTSMTRNNLGVVNVSQDRDKGVITLTGDVEPRTRKRRLKA